MVWQYILTKSVLTTQSAIGAGVARMIMYLVTSYGTLSHPFVLVQANPSLQKERRIRISYVRRPWYRHLHASLIIPTEDFTIFLLWSLIELNVAMICACLPTLRPMASKMPHSLKSVDSLKGLLSFSKFRSFGSQKHTEISSPGSSRVDIK